MAVTMKITKSLFQKMAAYSHNTGMPIPTDVFDNPALVEMTAQGHTLRARIKALPGMEDVMVGVDLPVAAINLVMGGPMATEIKSVAMHRLMTFIHNVQYEVNEYDINKPIKSPANSKDSSVLPSLLNAKTFGGAKSGGYPTPLTLDELNNMAPVPLREAKYLMQRVQSTGAVYRAIAISQDVKVGALVRGGKVSVRVEGKITPAMRDKLVQAGFTDNSSYLSAHLFNEKDIEMSNRIVGASLFATGHQFDQVFTDLSQIPENQGV